MVTKATTSWRLQVELLLPRWRPLPTAGRWIRSSVTRPKSSTIRARRIRSGNSGPKVNVASSAVPCSNPATAWCPITWPTSQGKLLGVLSSCPPIQLFPFASIEQLFQAWVWVIIMLILKILILFISEWGLFFVIPLANLNFYCIFIHQSGCMFKKNV